MTSTLLTTPLFDATMTTPIREVLYKLLRLSPTAFFFKVSAWLGKSVAIRCLGTFLLSRRQLHLQPMGLQTWR